MSECSSLRYCAIPRRLPAMTRPAQILLGCLLVSGPRPMPFHVLEQHLATLSGLTLDEVRTEATRALEELLGRALIQEAGEPTTGDRRAAS